ncbi:AGE family epimerase/isomerase [bacterium]|nr:AGE family epimerase/isomerase [bacterium]
MSERLERIDSYLKTKLLPFWIENSVDEEYGGFLTYFDRDGKPTGETTKTLLCQERMVFTMASAHRAGLGGGKCLEIARKGLDFMIDVYWDAEHGGWFWIADREGNILDDSKIMYGQNFGIYAPSEVALAGGGDLGHDMALKSFAAIQAGATDTLHGGYYEMLHRDWSPKPGGPYGGDRKSLDIHMHMMEALTNLYEMTGSPLHERKLRDAIVILLGRMLDPVHGTGIAQFALDWTPLPAILFRNVWGADRDNEGAPRPLDNTSYGHNIELAWLLKHAADVLGDPIEHYLDPIRKICRHTERWGIDHEHGGVFVEGPADGPARDMQKEFWQQAEVLVGMLDACLLFGERRYWDAFTGTMDFLWQHGINHDVGEWYALLDRDGTVLWDYLGHAWKISYHTVRSMIECVKRLRRLLESA